MLGLFVNPMSDASQAPPPRMGFSFVEVLFAVMILGIGFIMAAAIFPVSIRQATTAADETLSAAVAWDAINEIREKLGDEDLTPYGWYESDVPAVVRSFRDPQARGTASLTVQPTFNSSSYFGSPRQQKQPPEWLWRRVKSEMVSSADPRFAWVALFRRDIHEVGEWTPYAQVIVIVARAPDGSVFSAKDVDGQSMANLQPRPVTFNLTSDGKGPLVDQIVEFTAGEVDAVAEGTFLVIALDRSALGVETHPGGFMNGRVFRIGNRLDGNKWELSPTTPFIDNDLYYYFVHPTGLTKAEGFVVGRPTTASGYDGAAIDLAAYSAFIPVRYK